MKQTCRYCKAEIDGVRANREYCGYRCWWAAQLKVEDERLWRKCLRNNRYHCPMCAEVYGKVKEWQEHLLDCHQHVCVRDKAISIWDVVPNTVSVDVYARVQAAKRKHEQAALPATVKRPKHGKQPKVEKDVFTEVEWTHPQFLEKVTAWRRERGL